MFDLEKEVVMGTFTNTTEYLPALESSIKRFLPNIEYIRHLENLPIKFNFEKLRSKFIETGKRFWLFLDHDIQFVSPETIRIALETMISMKFALVGAYSSYYLNYVAKDGELNAREVGWCPGYFQLVDSRKVGHIGADLNLPDGNTAIDTSYCTAIRAEGYKIGISPTWVYHQYKPLNLCYFHVINMTNDYLRQKWGQFYFDTCSYSGCLIGPDPGSEVWNWSEDKLESDMQDLFESRVDKKADGAMGDLMYVLKDIGSHYESITEFGVQKGSSTIAFACGKPKKSFCSYEIYDVMDAKVKAMLGRYAGWKYHISDSRSIEIDETDVLFIDSDHMAFQLLEELKKHSSKVKHLIVLHDTLNCGIWGERSIEPQGLFYAINEFLETNQQWSINRTYMNDHGLTILERKV